MNNLLKCLFISSSLLITSFAHADTGIIKFYGSIVESTCKISSDIKPNSTVNFNISGNTYCNDNEAKTTSLKKIESKADLTHTSSASTRSLVDNKKTYKLNTSDTGNKELYVFNVDYK